MARNNENTRHSNYVIRIVCEGDKTEPLFFTSLCDLYCKDNDGMDVRTIPQPHIPQDEETDNSPRGSYKGKKRKIKTDGKDAAGNNRSPTVKVGLVRTANLVGRG